MHLHFEVLDKVVMRCKYWWQIHRSLIFVAKVEADMIVFPISTFAPSPGIPNIVFVDSVLWTWRRPVEKLFC